MKNNQFGLNNSSLRRLARLAVAFGVGAALGISAVAVAAPAKQQPAEKIPPGQARTGTPCTSVEAVPGVVTVTHGKYARIKTPGPISRFFVFPTTGAAAIPAVETPAAQPRVEGVPQLAIAPTAALPKAGAGVAQIDVVLLSPQEIFVLGKSIGSTQIILQAVSGQCTLVDVAVVMDTAALQAKLGQILPGEKNIKVNAAADSLILSGTVSDAVKVNTAVALAGAYVGGEKKIINMLSTGAPQQVMLEVKVAEVSKNLLDKLGAEFSQTGTSGNFTFTLLSRFLTGSAGVLDIVKKTGKTTITLDAQKNDGLIKILAEPTIMAMSGQEGAFLAGGRIFIPVPQSGALGGFATITLEEKEFGVGLKFTPTVLEGGRINLRVTPEVSELSATGTTVSASGSSSVIPTFTTRRASTTVQLYDGQSLAIGGLIKNNITETIKAFPILGEIPILGALFRSAEFQSDKTELLFVVTPRLVKPLPPDYKLPTDAYIEPSRPEFFLEGRMEGRPREPEAEAGGAPSPAPAQEPAPAQGPAPQPERSGGFQMK